MNFKKAVILLGCATPVCALLNCLVMFFTIESNSGFFRTGYTSLAAVMLGLAAVLTVLSAAAFIRVDYPDAPKFWPYVSCLSSLALGICLIIESFNFVPLVGTSPTFAFFICIFGILSGIVFVWRAAACLSFVPEVKPLYIIPVVFYLMRVVSAFIAYAAVATITETVLELFALCAMLIFTLNLAKAENGIKNKKGNLLSRPMCIACAIFILAQIAPYIVNHFAKEEILIHANSLFAPSSVMLFVFIILMSIFKDKKELN